MTFIHVPNHYYLNVETPKIYFATAATNVKFSIFAQSPSVTKMKNDESEHRRNDKSKQHVF